MELVLGDKNKSGAAHRPASDSITESWSAVTPESNGSKMQFLVVSYVSKIITTAPSLSVQRQKKKFFFIFTNCDLKIRNISILIEELLSFF